MFFFVALRFWVTGQSWETVFLVLFVLVSVFVRLGSCLDVLGGFRLVLGYLVLGGLVMGRSCGALHGYNRSLGLPRLFPASHP